MRLLKVFLNPYLQIFLGAVLDTAGQILMRKGAEAVGPSSGPLAAMGFVPLASGWIWLGIAAYLISVTSWLYVLRTIPLSVAFPLISVIYLLVPLSAKLFLHERISLHRWLGIGLVVIGVFAIIRPLI